MTCSLRHFYSSTPPSSIFYDFGDCVVSCRYFYDPFNAHNATMQNKHATVADCSLVILYMPCTITIAISPPCRLRGAWCHGACPGELAWQLALLITNAVISTKTIEQVANGLEFECRGIV